MNYFQLVDARTNAPKPEEPKEQERPKLPMSFAELDEYQPALSLPEIEKLAKEANFNPDPLADEKAAAELEKAIKPLRKKPGPKPKVKQ